MNIEIQKQREKLEAELKRLESEILDVAEKYGDSTWEAVQTEESDTSDREEVAESIENYETNASITSDLKREINNVKEALSRIDSGEYGKCKVCQAEIEKDRLDISPEAVTCKLHMN